MKVCCLRLLNISLSALILNTNCLQSNDAFKKKEVFLYHDRSSERHASKARGNIYVKK